MNTKTNTTITARTKSINILLFILFNLYTFVSHAAPVNMNFQANIKKPDGTSLEAGDVSFRFKYLNSTGTCTVYMEDFPNISMAGKAGNISIKMGNGTRSFPTSGPTTLVDTFSNRLSNSMACWEHPLVSPYSPLSADENRRLIVEFVYTGSGGVQVINGIEINSVPYAMVASTAENADRLGGFAANLFTRFSDFQTCPAGEFLLYDGTAFVCDTPSSFTGAFAGDVTGNQGTTSVTRLRGIPLVATVPTLNQILQFDGTNWVPATIAAASSGTVTAVSSANGDIVIINPNTTPQLTLNSGVGPNQILKLNASSQIPAVDGSLLTDLDAGQIATGTLPINRGGTNATTANGALNNLLPTQATHTGKVLQTDGTNTSWVLPNAGTVTSVGATLPLTSTGGATPTIAMPAATGSQDGYLAAADFTLFNSKVSSGGLGTANRVSKFTAAGVIGDSNITDSGTLVSISTDARINTLTIGLGAGSIASNTALGEGVLASNTTGSYNTGTGLHSLGANTVGTGNAAFGVDSLFSNTTGNENTAVGSGSLYSNLNGVRNTALGQVALHDTTGSNNTGVGYNSGYNITTGSNNVILGSNDGAGIATSSNNIIISDGAGNIRQQINSAGFVGIGMAPSTYMLNVNGDINIPTGSNFKINGVNLGSGTIGGSGTTNRVSKFTAAGTIGNSNISDDGTLVTLTTDASVNGVRVGRGGGAISSNTAVGGFALSGNTTGTYNSALGYSALVSNTTGNYNNGIGSFTLAQNTTGSGNTVTGFSAAQVNTTGDNNSVYGMTSLAYNQTGSGNSAFGASTLQNSTTGANNTAVGYSAGISVTTGSNNILLGSSSGTFITTGSNNVVLGSNNGASIATTNNNVIISDGAGNIRQQIDSAGLVGIGMAPSTYMLSVNGDINIPTGSNFKINGVNLGSGTIGGSGTTNKVSKFTASGTIGDSNISDNGTVVSTSTDMLVNGVTVGRSIGTNSYSTVLGQGALANNTTGDRNVAIGRSALLVNTIGNWNAAVGTESLKSNISGEANAAFGDNTLTSNTTGNNNTAVGDDALAVNTTGHNNTAVGQSALYNSSGLNNTAIGYNAGSSITTGMYNVVIGSSTGAGIATSSNNIILSDGQGNIRQQINGAGQVGIGMAPATYMLSVNGDINIPTGSNFKINGVNLGSGTIGGSGTTDKISKFTASGTIGDSNITDNGTVVSISTDASVNGVLVGKGAGAIATNTGVGIATLLSNTTGTFNTATGASSLLNTTTGASNSAFGANALVLNTTGDGNTATGKGALNKNIAGSYNTASGSHALDANTSGINNVAIGSNALFLATTGNNNTAIGYHSGESITTGSNNVVLGSNNGAGIATSSNNIIISDGAGTIRQFINSAGNVGLGTSNPVSKLDVNGGLTVGTYAGTTAAPANGINVSGQVLVGASADFADTYGPHQLLVKGANDKNVMAVSSNDDSAQFAVYLNGAGAYTRAQVQTGSITNSNYGIFTNNDVPQFTLTTNGGAKIGRTLDLNTIVPPVNGLLVGGSVGIGINSPSYKLDVNGDINIPTGSNYKINGVNIVAGGITALTGDVTATGPGSVASTIAANAVTTGKINALAVTDAKINDVAFSKITGLPATLALHGITDGVRNAGVGAGNIVSTIQSGNTIGRPAFGTDGRIYIDTQAGAIYRDSGSAWVAVSSTGAAGVTGTGTINTVPKFTAAGAIGNSNISDDGTLVTVTTDGSFNGLTVGRGTGSFGTNTAFGRVALTNASTGSNNNTGVGYFALNASLSSGNNTAIGSNALSRTTSGGSNVAVGADTLSNVLTNGNSTALGYSALNQATGGQNIAIGSMSGSSITTGTNNVILGSNNGATIATTSNNVIIADGAGNIRQQIDSTGKVGIGMAPATYALSVSGDINLTAGSNFKINGVDIVGGAGGLTTYTVRAATVTQIGVLSGTSALDGVTIVAGNRVLVKNQTLASANGVYIVAAGAWARATDMDTWGETFGYTVRVTEGNTNGGLTFTSTAPLAGTLNTTFINWYSSGGNETRYNTTTGIYALSNNTSGTNNTAYGNEAMRVNFTGSDNTATGYHALWSNTGSDNSSAYGSEALYSATGAANTAFGSDAGKAVSTGANNTFIGYNSGSAVTTGSNNVILGSHTGTGFTTTSNNIIISDGSGNARMIANSSGNVAIGNIAPRAKLEVDGTVLNKPATSNATTTIDFNTGNLQYTALDCQTFNLRNLKDGGSFMFVVQGTNPATCIFNGFSDAGVTPITVKMPPDHGVSTNGKQTVYNLVVMGTTVYISWTPGY